ncbi:2-oxoglutarate and iron-dependent oxygenase domain-containing protein [Streptomyces sp. FXJ1.172]|uniref:2-oxoglutarate and iron-dependent oxygenase domain-containing protein n=1 Tax=Streptomyces sp. FXJ1.172 TaxID=710705 RepID=UPI0007CFFA18|nr:2-oxoglutarate and iron-dependent oxygenase domain-containing protein [Streptomyces sp. FXJ1.172]WEO93240.1 2-oxoglutarate and iron-dependent oxygenase domain-containing protein [Streptomyces sp. FXJ1.172]
MAQSTALSVIDISRFHAPDADRDAFRAELRSAAHEVGLSYVTGNGVPAALREEVLSAARHFFTLPELKDIVSRWQAQALRVSREVLRALAAALGQDEGCFDQWFDDEAAVPVKIVSPDTTTEP